MPISMAEQSSLVQQRGFEYGVRHFLSPREGELLDIVAETLTLEIPRAQELLHLGAIYVNGQRCRENLHLPEQTYLRVHSKPRRFKDPGLWNERVVFENADFIIVNKPSSLPCHPSVDNIQENLLAFLSQSRKEEFLLTHRLDVPTSGLLVLARHKKFQSAFNSLLMTRHLRKVYRAVCVGNPPHLGLHRHYMEPGLRAPKKIRPDPMEKGLLCELSVLASEALNNAEFEVRLQLHTGRTHQIRAQMAFLGAPVRGDVAYGAPQIYAEEKIDLTACELAFSNPLDEHSYEFKIQ